MKTFCFFSENGIIWLECFLTHLTKPKNFSHLQTLQWHWRTWRFMCPRRSSEATTWISAVNMTWKATLSTRWSGTKESVNFSDSHRRRTLHFNSSQFREFMSRYVQVKSEVLCPMRSSWNANFQLIFVFGCFHPWGASMISNYSPPTWNKNNHKADGKIF